MLQLDKEWWGLFFALEANVQKGRLCLQSSYYWRAGICWELAVTSALLDGTTRLKQQVSQSAMKCNGCRRLKCLYLHCGVDNGMLLEVHIVSEGLAPARAQARALSRQWPACEELQQAWGSQARLTVFSWPPAYKPPYFHFAYRAAYGAREHGAPLFSHKCSHDCLSSGVPESTSKIMLELQAEMGEWCRRPQEPTETDNSVFRWFFPTYHAVRVYAMTNRLSWALGQLVTNQHPLREHLYTTGRHNSPTCPVCGSADETVEHFLFECAGYETQREFFYLAWTQATEVEYPDWQAFLDITTHTANSATLYALDRYVVRTRRFFNKDWLRR